MPLRPWTVLRRELVFDASPWLRVWRERVVGGRGGREHDFFTVDKRDFALVVALTDDGDVLMVRQYRHGVGAVSLGLPSGLVDEGEGPEEAARRELLEETGHEAREWEHLGSFVVDALRGAGRAHCYLARGARRVGDATTQDELEDLELVVRPLEEALEAPLRGEVHALGPAACLALAGARLRARPQ